ncbi:phage tail spike protein [Adlercreutzia sp. ZJ138]|uniref:phage tail spike protein n=1 Tax=Adlercreutzia sp. ZJ138 TaxID=2709405 RepID=UPI0013EAF2C0|nr:phage tail spike protein [Adlercreutzia sp. ZJ138]
MAGAVPALWWFDRWDERIGLLRVAGELVHTEELNGEDTLEFSSFEVPAKGDRLLWLDNGTWREHVVVRTDEPMAGPCAVYAESSLCELLDDFVEEAQLASRTAAQALAAVLAPTRWGIEHCADLGSAGCLVYHRNALWALRRVAEVWGGEVTSVITVADGRVASRAVRLDERRGAWRGLRLTYGKNMAGCTRTVLEQDVYTALYGFGAGLPYTDEQGNYKAGYRRKLTFGEVNGGLNYVADEGARETWGRWNADRTAKVHSFGQVTFSDVTDPARLLALTRKALVEASQPKVSYEVDVAALSGDDAELGDAVAVIDTSRDPEWRLTARVVKLVRTFGESVAARVTIGCVEPADYARASALVADVSALRDDVAGIDGNLSTAASVSAVESAVTTAIDDLDELSEMSF